MRGYLHPSRKSSRIHKLHYPASSAGQAVRLRIMQVKKSSMGICFYGSMREQEGNAFTGDSINA
ncbi:MAG: hypothetical protein V5A59_03960 [Bacteroidales bacterium]